MRHDTESCLKKFKVATIGNKKNIAALDSAIPENETIFYIAPATVRFFIPNQTVKLQAVGAIAFTPNNCYVMNMLNLAEPQIYPLNSLMSVDHSASGLMASLFELVFFDGTIFKFDGCRQRDLAAELQQQIKSTITLRK